MSRQVLLKFKEESFPKLQFHRPKKKAPNGTGTTVYNGHKLMAQTPFQDGTRRFNSIQFSFYLYSAKS